MHVVGQREAACHVAFGVVVAIQQIDGNPGLSQSSHLPDEEESGVEVLPVAVVDVAGNDHEVDGFIQGDVHQLHEGIARGSAQLLGWCIGIRGQPAKRAVQVQVSGVNELHSVLLQLRQFMAGTHAQQADAAVVGQLVARVGDVEVAHGELADAVSRREDRLAFLHGQPLGVIGEVGRFGIQQRVVVAAAQLQRDLAGDGTCHPALGGLAQHDGLRVEPAALVQQTTQTPVTRRS